MPPWRTPLQVLKNSEISVPDFTQNSCDVYQNDNNLTIISSGIYPRQMFDLYCEHKNSLIAKAHTS